MSSTIFHRRLCSLSTPELFILCSLRLISQAMRDGREIDSLCREGFEIARLNVTHAHRLAATIRAIEAAARPLDVRGAKCAEVGEDEELVLQVLLLLQHENEFGARRVLWRLLPPAAARIVLANLDEVAIAMVRAGLLLPQFPYALRPCPAEALVARRLGETAVAKETAENFWLNQRDRRRPSGWKSPAQRGMVPHRHPRRLCRYPYRNRPRDRCHETVAMIRRPAAIVAALLFVPAPLLAQTPPPVARDADAPPPTPFTLGERWFMGLTAQFDGRAHKDADLDSAAEGDVANVRPQMQFAFLYEVPNTFRFFSATKINRDLTLNEGATPEHRELLADLDELYVRWVPFQGGVVSVGRSRMNDPRNWVFASSDDKNDNIQLQYRTDTDFIQVVAAARDLLPSNLFEPKDQHRSLNYAATFEHSFSNGMRAGGFLLLQDRRFEGDVHDRTYFGARSRGTVASGHIDYWADTIFLRGTSGTVPMRSYAFDAGIIYKFLDPLQVHIVGSYAYGSGDRDPLDGVDRRFRQTGIQENRYQYGGVSRFKYYGETLNPELSNLAVATAAIGFKPNVLSSVDLVVHHYELAHADGGLIASRLNRQPTGASRNAGNAVDLVAGYRDRTALEFEFFGGWFMPGPAFGPTRADSLYGMFKIKYNLRP